MKKKKLKDYSDEELARMDYNTKERLILEDKIHKIVKYVLLAIIVIFLIITFFNSFKTIPTGFVGVKTRFGQVQDTMLNEGLNLKIPFIEKIVLMDCRTQKTEYTMEASSKDLQKISNYKIAINYNITKDTANQLYKSARVENQKKIENAQADAEVMAAQNAQITDNYLKLKEIENQKAMIEKWNGQLPNTMLNDGINGLFNIGQ